ncbi:MAG: DUF805 domain-containing protein [Caulobacter sp.]
MQLLKGRINRATYWVIVGVAIAAALISGIVFKRPMPAAQVVLLIAAVPRLHDLGRSGWWAGGFFIIETALIFGGGFILPPQAYQSALGLVVLLLAGLLVWLGALPGKSAENRFGPPPPKGLSFKPAPPAEA